MNLEDINGTLPMLSLWKEQRLRDKKKQYNMRNVSYVTMSGYLWRHLGLLLKDLRTLKEIKVGKEI